jgi:two-component system phosphate regulon response regulator PhoB
MASSVVVIHADRGLRAGAREALELATHAVQEAADTGAAWRLIETTVPDVILLPWAAMKSAREILTRLRERPATREIRVLVWAAQSEFAEAMSALELGADDCFAVPFEPAELIARGNACLRRPAASAKPDQLTAGPLVLDKAVHCLLVDNQPVELAPTEFRLLAFFLENQGRVFSRDELLRRAWSRNIKAGHRTVDVHVRRLRQLLEPFNCEDMIQTVRGFGYRFAQPAREASPSRPLALAARR